jgi:hypothetical protein
MVSPKNNIDIPTLQKLYNQDAEAKAILDYLASRERNRSETKLDRLLWILRVDGNQVHRGAAIRVFRALEDVGCGRFVAGRKGHPSRFEWTVGMVDVARVAAGETVKIEAAPIDENDEAADDLLEHHFLLRKDLDVPLRLPGNLTAREAARLAAFIQSLPFDTATE